MWAVTSYKCVYVMDRKAENGRERRTNPVGQIAESSAKYQNLIISIIIFIIFIHFLPARLNAVTLVPSRSPLSHRSPFCTLIYFSHCCSIHWRHVNLSVTVTDSTQVADRKSSSFGRMCCWCQSWSGNPIYYCFCGRKRLPLTLIDNFQICRLRCRDLL